MRFRAYVWGLGAMCCMMWSCQEKIPDGYATEDTSSYRAVDETPKDSTPEHEEPAPCEEMRSCITLAERARAAGEIERALPFAHQACLLERTTCVYEVGVLIMLDRYGPMRELAGELCKEHTPTGKVSMCAAVATSYLEDEPTDFAASYQFASMGCERGDVESCYTIALGLNTGWYDQPNGTTQAFSIYERLCHEQEHMSSCQNLGVMHASPGEFEDPDEAVRLYTLTCSRGNVRACVDVGARLYTGRDVPMDKKRGMELLEQACADEKGAGYGCAIYGEYLYTEATDAGADRAELERAFNVFERSCEAGSARGCFWGAKRGMSQPMLMSSDTRTLRYTRARQLAATQCEKMHRGKECEVLSELLMWLDAGIMDEQASAHDHKLACTYDVRTCHEDELP